MSDLEKELTDQRRKLVKALNHLDYSYQKVLNLSNEVEKLNDEDLEVWESFASRFSRVADMFLTRYLRTKILNEDPGYSGTLRDYINQAEKLGLVNDADTWMSIRELRNISAHDYSEKDLSAFFNRLRKECPFLLSIRKILV